MRVREGEGWERQRVEEGVVSCPDVQVCPSMQKNAHKFSCLAPANRANLNEPHTSELASHFSMCR